MPHIVIEYSGNRQGSVRDMVSAAFRAANASGLFSENDIKSRAIAVEQGHVGAKPGGFIHAGATILEGRTVAQKQQLSHALMAALEPFAHKGEPLSVDIREMVKETYNKKVV